MTNAERWIPISIVVGIIMLLLVSILAIMPVLAQGPGGMPSGRGQGGMMGGGMMQGYGPGSMMGYTQGFTGTMPFGPGGMMGGMMHGMMGPMMGNMMLDSNSPFFTADPLTIDEAAQALDNYVANLNDDNLAVEDIMIFNNHAYAEIVETDTGIGVMEVLVDPETLSVYPEMGPNMMWNQKYGMMAGYGRYGMMGMMMGQFGFNGAADEATEMSITPSEAVEIAQEYLDSNFAEANLTADDQAEQFYGYYTLHVNRDGETVGMLSVNGFSGQSFPHTWHGELLEMSEE